MLRNTKWKLEKAKVKVVFRLQFHATNIPQSGWDKLFICFIPTESGKIIAKTSKANVRNGTCKWPDPIYETTRLLLDSRNKRYEDKFYNLIVGMGTSHASILGETTINLADYADALNPFVVSLPLHGSENGTILHVTVQLLTAKTGFREFEQQFDKGLQSSSNLNRETEPSIATSASSELLISDDYGNKVNNTETHFVSESKELISIVEETGVHDEFSDSLIEYNGSFNASENTDHSKDNNLAIALEENDRLRGSLEMAESFIFELKQELNTLHNHANEMNMETQKISQHLTDEISSGLKLEREIMILRSECSKFKDELQQLKEIKLRSQFMDKTHDQPVNGLFLVEDRIRDLQKKILIGFCDSDLSFIHTDLELLIGIVQNLEKGTGFTRGLDLGESQSFEFLSQLNEAKAERGNLIKKMNEMECYYESLVQELEENRDRILVEFQKLRYEHSTCVYTISTCKSETESIRLCMKDQILKFDKERLALGCVNEELEKRVMVAEAFVQELEENRERILNEFESLKNEHSTCGDNILTYKSEMESIRRDMKNQTLKFVKEKHDLGCVKEELEKRVLELEEKREQILKEFESLKSEHSTCVNTILTCKTEKESICHDLNHQTLQFAKERNDLTCVNEELEKRIMTAESLVQELENNQEQILGEFQSLKNEHSTCADTILIYKTKTESIHNDMNDQILRLKKEIHNLVCVNEELKKRVMTNEALVQELKEKQELITGEFQSLENEHSACANTISACKAETELIRHDLNDQILRLTQGRNAFGCANEELEKNREQILKEFESLKNEHSACGNTISTLRTKTESIRHDTNDQILKYAKERHALSCVNEELEKRVSELEENREQILKEFESLEKEHSTCGDTISTLKTETESVRKDMNDQILRFTEERNVLDCANKELEKKVTTLESALERGRLNYSIAVTKLQNDLDMLSSQVSSMFETNQNLIKQTFSQSSIPLSENYPNLMENRHEKHLSGGDYISDDELYEIFFANFYLDAYSMILQEKCLEVIIDANKMKEEISDYAQKLALLHEKKEPERHSESLRIAFMKEQCQTTVQELKEQLFVSKRHGDDILIKLQDALDEIESRKKSKASYFKKIEELSFKIGGLEGELQSIKAELDCALLNLECCKEEKEKIVARIIELEGMKDERSIPSMMSCGSNFQYLQRELMQLHKANEDLQGMYPNFKDFLEDGNALERVLALEIELAESLTAKKKSSIQFQSSFLKQHSDEEAVFKSFRDINELIKDTLEIKSKYINVETELKEMHERYSQLSLQFAEVEGERQKLMMTVKNVRSPRNLVQKNRSSSETLDDNLL